MSAAFTTNEISVTVVTVQACSSMIMPVAPSMATYTTTKSGARTRIAGIAGANFAPKTVPMMTSAPSPSMSATGMATTSVHSSARRSIT